MRQRKSFFDDRVFYDPKQNTIWIGRPDTKWSKEPWDWFLWSPGKRIPYKNFGPPKHFVEIGREPAMTIC